MATPESNAAFPRDTRRNVEGARLPPAACALGSERDHGQGHAREPAGNRARTRAQAASTAPRERGRRCPQTRLTTASLQLFQSKKSQENEPLTRSLLRGPEPGPGPRPAVLRTPRRTLPREGSWRRSRDSGRPWKGRTQLLERVQRDPPTGPTGAPDTGPRVTSAAESLWDDLEAISPREGSGAVRRSHGDQVGQGGR